MHLWSFRTSLPPHLLRTTTVPLDTFGLGFERRLLRQRFLASKSLRFFNTVGESANPLQMIGKEVQSLIGGKSVLELETVSVSVSIGI